MQGFRYSLTEMGGDVWSIERTPIWGTYCDDTGFFDESENEYIEFVSTNKVTAYECAKHVHQYKLYNFKIENLEFSESPQYPLFYWKKFQSECSWRTLRYPDEDIDINWKNFEKTRTYWRTLSELQKFL